MFQGPKGASSRSGCGISTSVMSGYFKMRIVLDTYCFCDYALIIAGVTCFVGNHGYVLKCHWGLKKKTLGGVGTLQNLKGTKFQDVTLLC